MRRFPRSRKKQTGEMSTICCIKNLVTYHRFSPSLPILTTYQSTRSVRGQKKYLTWPNDWLPFQWVKPEPTISPELFETGDPEQKIRETVDLEDYQDGFEFLKDRTDVPEKVKNLFKLKSADRWIIAENLRRKRIELFRRHPLDEVSAEAKVARYTSTIRSLVEIIKYQHPNDAASKQAIVRSRQRRDKYLNMLWRNDRERYEIVKEKLNIDYTPGLPGEEKNPPIHRKATLRVLTSQYCDRIRKEKLESYHRELKEKQEGFLKEKEDTLVWIEREMNKFHIKEDDVSGKYTSQHDPRPVHSPPPRIPPIEV